MINNPTCDCGGSLVEQSDGKDGSFIFIDSARVDFVCSVENCGRTYSIEYNNITGTECDCGCTLEEDDDSTEQNVCNDTINAFAACPDCKESTEIEYAATEIKYIETISE